MKTFCSECKKECKPELYDRSFGHAFGTEVVSVTLSACCEAVITDAFGAELTDVEFEFLKEQLNGG